MLHITDLEDGVELFKALASKTRISILEQLSLHRGIRMGELADSLHISEGTLSSHIRQLEKCGILPLHSKYCHLPMERASFDKILIEAGEGGSQSIYEVDMKVGQYCRCEISPACGLAAAGCLIGRLDDPGAFHQPAHMDADLLWLSAGFVEYSIPCSIPVSGKITQIIISMELNAVVSSGHSISASNLRFSLNGICLGDWAGDWDCGEGRGFYTPGWWRHDWKQYGMLKLVTLNGKGTFLDGIKISEVTIGQMEWDRQSPLRLKLEVLEGGIRQSGLSIFGEGFGNYHQGISIQIYYSMA